MNRPATLRRRAGLLALLAATAWFVTGEDLRDAAHLRELTALGATDAVGTPVQPSGDTRALVLPLASMDAHWWVLHTERLIDTDRPVRHTDRDNPPAGREVHWSSALTVALAGLAWLIRAFSSLSPSVSVQVAALWIGPLLLAVTLSGLFLLVRRRFDAGTAICLVVALGTSASFLQTFAVGEADHHGVAATACLLAVWLLVAAGAGRTRSAGAGPPTFASPPDPARAHRGFAAAGLAGAVALWISAATAIPVLAAIAAGALLSAWLTRLAKREAGQSAPDLWSVWGRWGAAASLVLYSLEYLPGHAGLRLEVNHPLHALAWWGGSAWLTRAVRRIDGGAWFAGRSDLTWSIAQTIAVFVPPALIVAGGARFFVLNDPFLWALHHDYIQEFRSLFAILREAGWASAPLLWLAILPTAWLLGKTRRTAPDTAALLALPLAATATAMSLAIVQIRWQGLASALLAGLLAALFLAARRHPSATRAERRLRVAAGLLIGLGLLQYPVLATVAHLHPDPDTPRVDRAELASLVVRDVAWALHGATEPGSAVILSGPTTSTQLAYFGGFRVLGTLYWENLPGLRAAAAIFGSPDAAEALRLCQQHGVTHLVLFSWDDFGPAYARLHRSATEGAAAMPAPGSLAGILAARRIPTWLRPLAYDIPPALDLADQRVQIYEVHPEQTPAEAALHLVRYQREIGHDADARATLARLAETPATQTASPDLAAALAEEARALGDEPLARRFSR